MFGQCSCKTLGMGKNWSLVHPWECIDLLQQFFPLNCWCIALAPSCQHGTLHMYGLEMGTGIAQELQSCTWTLGFPSVWLWGLECVAGLSHSGQFGIMAFSQQVKHLLFNMFFEGFDSFGMHQYFEGEQFGGYFLVCVLYYEKIWKAGYAQLESFAYSGLIHFFFSFFQQDLCLKLCWKLESLGMEILAIAHWVMKLLTKGHTYHGLLSGSISSSTNRRAMWVVWAGEWVIACGLQLVSHRSYTILSSTCSVNLYCFRTRI